MGISAEPVATDVLGRRSGPRRRYTIVEKRSIVEETQVHGASVPEVAQRHGVNANLLSVWRRLYREGSLNDERSTQAAALLPVQVSTPTLLPTERVLGTKMAERKTGVHIEVEFAGGRRLHIRGPLDRVILRELISALSLR